VLQDYFIYGADNASNYCKFNEYFIIQCQKSAHQKKGDLALFIIKPNQLVFICIAKKKQQLQNAYQAEFRILWTLYSE